MNMNTKILNILIEDMGAANIIAFCQEHIKAKTPAPVASPPSAPAPSEAPKAPVKVVSKKVVVKKTEGPAVKNLSAELAAVASPPAAQESWVCPPCGKGPGNDHRPCVFNTFGCDVEAWETAIGLRKAAEQKPVEEKKATGPVIVKKATGPVVIKKAATAPPPAAPAPAPAAEPPAAEAKKPGRPKKVTTEAPRCDGRIYGEEVEMEGTKAPNGKPLRAYRPAQCERKGLETLAVPEEGDPRHLKDGEEPTEDEGKAHLCKICIKRWEARAEHADNWHGFFDDNGAPETSHFVNGAWYKKKMAAAAKGEADE